MKNVGRDYLDQSEEVDTRSQAHDVVIFHGDLHLGNLFERDDGSSRAWFHDPKADKII